VLELPERGFPRAAIGYPCRLSWSISFPNQSRQLVAISLPHSWTRHNSNRQGEGVEKSEIARSPCILNRLGHAQSPVSDSFHTFRRVRHKMERWTRTPVRRCLLSLGRDFPIRHVNGDGEIRPWKRPGSLGRRPVRKSVPLTYPASAVRRILGEWFQHDTRPPDTG
jgi:hypothetical protein